MGAQENIDVVRRAYEAFGTGDMETLGQLIADDAVWHLGGRNALTGDYEGKEAIFGVFGQMAERSEMTMSVDIHDIVASDDHVVVLATLEGGGSRGTLSTRAADSMHVKDGQITEFWTFPEDLYGLDAYFG